jgi:biofilm PGA synthesis N-glycosyltransferase PgaC
MLTYAIITPARDEAENLTRLAWCIADQTLKPSTWVVVDNGSTDDTLGVARAVEVDHPWLKVVSVPGESTPTREAPIARALRQGLEALLEAPDIVVKLDADVSFEPDYLERLVGAFEADAQLGIASGSGYEEEQGVWRQQHMTGSSVWGASRAYRWVCLQELLPLDERVGWDGIDVIKANMRGWRTGTLLDLPFRHHRKEGLREGSRSAAWAADGRVAHYLGYRLSYLLARTLFRAIREPAALAMVGAYSGALLRREARCGDEDVVQHLREQQRLRRLPVRAREAFGRR